MNHVFQWCISDFGHSSIAREAQITYCVSVKGGIFPENKLSLTNVECFSSSALFASLLSGSFLLHVFPCTSLLPRGQCSPAAGSPPQQTNQRPARTRTSLTNSYTSRKTCAFFVFCVFLLFVLAEAFLRLSLKHTSGLTFSFLAEVVCCFTLRRAVTYRVHLIT